MSHHRRNGRRLTTLAVCAACAGLASCDGPAGVADALQHVDSVGVRLTTIAQDPDSLPTWQLAANAEYVLTGSNIGDSTALSLVGDVRWLSDGGIVAADPNDARLLIFGASGGYVRTLGRSGAGPGELQNLVSVSISAGDTIATFDASLRRLSIWHPSSGFARHVALGDNSALDSWPANAWRWNDSQLVVLQLSVSPRPVLSTGTMLARWPMRARLTLHDSSGRVVNSSPAFDAMYTGVYSTGDVRLPFSNQPFVSVTTDRIYFGDGATFVLAYLAPTFTLEGELRWPLYNEPLATSEVARVREEAMARLAQRIALDPSRDYFTREFDPSILPSIRPAIGRVLIDDESRVWVERFEAQRLGTAEQAVPDRWMVLRADGTPLARFTLPSGVRLEDVRRNSTVVVQRDSMDLQSIAVYNIVRP